MTPAEVLNAARLAADLLLELVPHDDAKAILDDAAVRRANAAADLAEKVKFGDP
jgi:hypothetical protein